MVWLCAILVSLGFAITMIRSALDDFSQSMVITTVGRAELPVTEIQVRIVEHLCCLVGNIMI